MENDEEIIRNYEAQLNNKPAAESEEAESFFERLSEKMPEAVFGKPEYLKSAILANKAISQDSFLQNALVFRAATILNEMLQGCPEDLDMFIRTGCPIAKPEALDSTPVIVMKNNAGQDAVGIIGILNGLLSDASYAVARCYSDGKLTGFKAVHKSDLVYGPERIRGFRMNTDEISAILDNALESLDELEKQ